MRVTVHGKAETDAKDRFRRGRAVGPGKIRLLEQIHKSGSITQAGRDLGLSYRRAWLLIDDLNNCFRHRVIEAETGGIAGGGTTLTQFGRKLVEWYHAIEADALAATHKHLRDLEGALKSTKERCFCACCKYWKYVV